MYQKKHNDSFVAYQTYQAFYRHFNSSYDYIKYNGKLNNNSLHARISYNQNNKQKSCYQDLADHENPKALCLSNFVVKPKSFITDIILPSGIDQYKKWKQRQSQITYQLSQDLEHFNGVKTLYDVTNDMPALIQLYVSEKITPETVVIIDSCINKLETWKSSDHPLVSQNCSNLLKYKPFVSYNKDKIKLVFQKKFSYNT